MNQAERYLPLRNELAVTRRGPLLVSEIPVELSELKSLAIALTKFDVSTIGHFARRPHGMPKPGWASSQVLRRK
jgi:hypothetical protein